MGLLIGGCAGFAQELPHFDFTTAQGREGWTPAHDVASLTGSSEGMVIDINGPDPYIYGPPQDYPAGQPLWMRMRLKSDQQGMGQVFYFTNNPTEENSVRFPVRAGVWENAHVPLPPLGPAYHLRFDPPGSGGRAIVSSISFETRNILKEPAWPTPGPPNLGRSPLAVRSGELEILHSRNQWGGFALNVAGQPMAVGLNRPLVGYLQQDQEHWVDLAGSSKVMAKKEGKGLLVTATVKDQDGARWELRQSFSPSERPGAINVETQVTVDRDRAILFLPLLVVLPGVGSFGQEKGQGLFAGLEYLDNEPGSSQADLTVPAYKRQVPDSLKITFPLMAIQARDRYLGLIWEKEPAFSALFDSPDRIFHSGGHLMGVLFPGSDGSNRVEGSLLPYLPETLAAGKPLRLKATMIGGQGKNVTPAVQQYIALRGMPPVPSPGMDFQGYISLAAAGWLDSSIREGSEFRHAYPGSFTPHPVADAALLMRWLARQAANKELSRKLDETAARAIAEVRPEDNNYANVSHVTYPAASLIFGHVAENAARARAVGHDLLKRFEPDGRVLYHKSPNGPDLGKTHFAPDANGLTAQVVSSLLEQAAISGDPELLQEGLRVLKALDRFSNTVPRGAQTWEVPLHTPDILASAYLVRAYTRGFELTGDSHFLEEARYWAWTGVPFVYLVNPASQPVGPYATIAVLGATQWVAPVWMGLPVQWCGLVYSDALYRLAPYDPGGPWEQLAEGITASGIQQSWPPGSSQERQGLLPDSFALRPQLRNDPAINPGTVETNAVRLFHGPALYSFHVFHLSGLMVHAPGSLTEIQDKPEHLSFTVQPWAEGPYYVLLVGVKKAPQLRLNGQATPLSTPQQFLPSEGQLILKLEGKTQVVVDS